MSAQMLEVSRYGAPFLVRYLVLKLCQKIRLLW